MRRRVTDTIALLPQVSGEGLIAVLIGEEDDPSGVRFGRLTIVESEFARVLTDAKREGSTLGPVIRQLWDEGSAATLTKQAVRVNGAHPVVIAHVTPRELRLRRAESDLAGGTLNRFLPLISERPHLLAHEPARPDLGDLAATVNARIRTARDRDEITREPATNHLWTEAYAALAAFIRTAPDGRTRTEITTKCFSGNIAGSEIDALIADLTEAGMVEMITTKSARGKPTTVCRWTGPAAHESVLTGLLAERTYEVTN